MVKNFVLMAFSTGQVSKESGTFTNYIGVASVNVEAVNPDKTLLNKLLNAETTDEPVYTGVQDSNGKQIKYARVDFIVKTVPESNNGIEATARMALFVRDQYRMNRDNTKIQVIDKYGRTAWATQDEFSKKTIPTYSNGNKANLDADYRPCYQGEEELTNFYKAFLNIPSPMNYKNGQWVPSDNLDDCLARFDNIANIFKGDFSELVDAWKLQQANKVKVLFGIRTTNEGRQYQAFYTRMFLKNGQSNYDRLEKDVTDAQAAGAFPNCEFKVVPLQEYVVESSPLETSTPQGANPFGSPDDNPFFK